MLFELIWTHLPVCPVIFDFRVCSRIDWLSCTVICLSRRKESDRGDGAAVEQSDLPPEEWRWQKDGPADRGGSMRAQPPHSATATQVDFFTLYHRRVDNGSGTFRATDHTRSGKSLYNFSVNLR